MKTFFTFMLEDQVKAMASEGILEATVADNTAESATNSPTEDSSTKIEWPKSMKSLDTMPPSPPMSSSLRYVITYILQKFENKYR